MEEVCYNGSDDTGGLISIWSDNFKYNILPLMLLNLMIPEEEKEKKA